MRNEILAAAEWLTLNLEVGDLDQTQLERFRWALIEALMRKYTDHWYQDMPWRGQGYRSILSADCAHVVDHVLRHASREANITDLPERLPVEPFVVYVDPGDVEVRFLKTHRSEVLYHQPSLYQPDANASLHRHSMPVSPSPSHSSAVPVRRPMRATSPPHNPHRRTLAVDDSQQLLQAEDDHQGMRFKNVTPTRDYHPTSSDNSVALPRVQAQSPPRAHWNSGSGGFAVKHVQQWTPPGIQASWAGAPSSATKTSLGLRSPHVLAGVV